MSIINFIKNIFFKGKNIKKEEIINKPDDWNLTISDLMEELKEGKRKSIQGNELNWAREYERTLIPKNYIFPKKGYIYESNLDQEVEFITNWMAPFSGGGKSILYKGEKIIVNDKILEDKPIGAYLIPVEYKKLEKKMVDENDRLSSKYGGFCFYFTTIELNENFTLQNKTKIF